MVSSPSILTDPTVMDIIVTASRLVDYPSTERAAARSERKD